MSSVSMREHRQHGGCHRRVRWILALGPVALGPVALGSVAIAAMIFNATAVHCQAQKFGITQDVDPQTVVGNENCVECHQAEVAAWKASSHATDSYEYLTKGDAAKIARNLGIASPTSEATCLTCHATQHAAGAFQQISCESCHNGAGNVGGKPGWLKIHSYYGQGLDPKAAGSREKETQANYEKRMELCDAAGMRRSENLYALAKNCLECHVVGSEELVNTGGHPAGSKGFEFYAWAQGEVRHNYQVDQGENAEAPTVWTTSRFHEGRKVDGHKNLMYLFGQIADLEVSLRNRSKATKKGDFASLAIKRIEDSHEELEDLADDNDISELKPVLDAVGNVEKELKKFTPQDAAKYGSLADQVGAVGAAISKSHNGSEWKKIKLPRRVKGDAPN